MSAAIIFLLLLGLQLTDPLVKTLFILGLPDLKLGGGFKFIPHQRGLLLL